MIEDRTLLTSFIVPAFNEELYLEPTLKAIHVAGRSLSRDYEIIVVNDDSTDGTRELAISLGARVVDVRCRKISAVRNAGARQAGGDLLIFVDADTVISSRTYRSAVRSIDGGYIGGGAIIRFGGKLTHLERYALNLLTLIYLRWIVWAAGCFVFVRRDAFERVGGFDETYFACEEIFLSLSLKQIGRFKIVSDPVVTSSRKLNSYSLSYLFWLLSKTLFGGPEFFRHREGLGFFYEGKR